MSQQLELNDRIDGRQYEGRLAGLQAKRLWVEKIAGKEIKKN